MKNDTTFARMRSGDHLGSQRIHCCINTSLDSFQTTQLLLNYATSLTSGKWPLRKESKFIRFSWILVKPMIGCLYLAYCSSYRIWVFQTQLYNGCHRF